MAALNVVELPVTDIKDVAAGLRRIADRIEAGEFGNAHNIAYVIDRGSGRISVGLLGAVGEAVAVGHFLLGCGQHQLQAVMESE